MTLLPEGGAAIPVSVTTTRKVQGGSAIPVYGYMTAPTDGRPAMGGSAIPVRVLTAADLKQNGGMWTLEGRPYAMPVYTAPAGVVVQGGPALAVYPVNAWPTVPVVPVVPWYLSGGVLASACVAAYQPKGAASLAASYVNLANPGTYDAAPGTAPTFNAATGWAFAAASSQYLRTGVVPAAGYSIFIQYSGGTAGSNACIAGVEDDVNTLYFFIQPEYVGTVRYCYGNNTKTGTGELLTGNVGMAGTTGYRNGTSDATNIGTWTGSTALDIAIGGCNANGAVGLFSTHNIQAVAIYNVTLTAPQVTALTTAMAAL